MIVRLVEVSFSSLLFSFLLLIKQSQNVEGKQVFVVRLSCVMFYHVAMLQCIDVIGIV